MKTENKLFSQGRIAVSLFFLTILAMFVINVVPVPNSAAYIQELSEPGAHLPDTLFYYDSHRLYDALISLGVPGREAYRAFLLTFDAVFPVLYSSALALSIWVLLRLAAPRSTYTAKLYFLPLLAGLFDYMENMSMLMILHYYPEHLVTWPTIAGCLTLAKWLISFISVMILAIAAILALWKKRGSTI
ncbi:hypothetical protein [Paenibacillus sp. SN-8-1]|uniref:hypothetical protein n=1 Tax=Paenibacillus sp. SN-8-1 TaxID=3435409 RepID=UPI003D9A1FD3